MADEKAAPKKQTKQEEEISPADLEVALAPGGPPIQKKVNPETPSQQQVDAAVSEIPGPPVTKVTVETDEESVYDLRPDDAALISQRVTSDAAHPAHTSKGHWSNPLLGDATDEEREANEKAYASRFG